jgi:3-oxoacyl-[acyl-carrier protein] reductase
MSSTSLSGNTALVTGASRGIGKAIVERLAELGCDVLAGVRTESDELAMFLDQLAKNHQVKIMQVHVDLSNTDTAAECAKKIALSSDIHILVNNAGVANGSTFQMTKMADFREAFEVNFFSTVAFTQLISRRMARFKETSIVNIGSTAGLNGDTGTSAYGSSKAALMYLTEVMARELGQSGIRVNAVAPTITETDMFGEMSEDSRNALIEAGAIRRAATPREIANVVAFLASPESSMITGQIIRVDGGQRGR